MQIKSKNKGFTLIELLVVIAIIGLLASIVMVSLNSARGKARDARRVSDVRQIQLALQMYYDSNGSYPAIWSGAIWTGMVPTFINAVPKDPDGTSAYQYCLSVAKGYHLGTRAGTVSMENPGGPLLNDADAVAGDCTAGGFSGADTVAPYVYDVIP